MEPSNTNLATNTRWVMTIPLGKVDENLSDTSFNLTTFTIPEVTIGKTEVTYKGYSYSIPTNVNTQDKVLTLDYLLDSAWTQYAALWGWVGKFTKDNMSGRPDNVLNDKLFVDCYITLLSEFKKPIFSIKFYDCWVSGFGSISVDYQDSESAVVVHNFTLDYSRFDFVSAKELNAK